MACITTTWHRPAGHPPVQRAARIDRPSELVEIASLINPARVRRLALIVASNDSWMGSLGHATNSIGFLDVEAGASCWLANFITLLIHTLGPFSRSH
jgi:hypothetical protein